MTQYFPFLLAQRLIITKNYGSAITFMIRLCFWGILISTFALTLVSAIMGGFEHATRVAIQGTHADLVIRSCNRGLNYQKIRTIIMQEYGQLVQEMSPSSFYYTLIDQSDEQTDLSTVVCLTVIDPPTAQKTTALADKIITPHNQSFVKLFTENSIIIGSALAQNLGITNNQPLTLLYPTSSGTHRTQLSLKKIPVQVTGIFKTGIEDLDAAGAFCSYACAQELFPDADMITSINIRLQPHVSADYAQKILGQRLRVPVESWKELYPTLASALLLERYAMAGILSLIVLVASITILALLCMYITHKKVTIALLLAMGMSKRAVCTAFILMGTGIAFVAAMIGLTLATICSVIVDHYKLIPLHAYDCITHLPAHINGTILITVLILVVMLSLLASWYSTRHINRMQLSSIFKLEN